MSNTSSMTSVQDVLKCLHEHGVQGNTARMEVVKMLDHKQVNTDYWYSPESITKQLNDFITLCLTGLCGEVPEPEKAILSKLKFELNKAEDRVVIYLADEIIGHIFWCNDTYTLCWEAHNTKNPEQQFESRNFSGKFDIATLMKKIAAVAEAISNGDCKVMPMGENMETHDEQSSMKQPERPVSFIDHTPIEAKEPTMEHSVYSRLEADKYMDWQANRIKQLEEALRQERDRFQPNGWAEAFTEMFETSIKSAVNDSLDKIETACVTALDKFCQQMDPSAYDGQ